MSLYTSHQQGNHMHLECAQTSGTKKRVITEGSIWLRRIGDNHREGTRKEGGHTLRSGIFRATKPRERHRRGQSNSVNRGFKITIQMLGNTTQKKAHIKLITEVYQQGRVTHWLERALNAETGYASRRHSQGGKVCSWSENIHGYGKIPSTQDIFVLRRGTSRCMWSMVSSRAKPQQVKKSEKPHHRVNSMTWTFAHRSHRIGVMQMFKLLVLQIHCK